MSDDFKHTQDNPYILTGYRQSITSKDAWHSLFYWHNETMNIWTHFIPALFYIGFIVHIHLNWTHLDDKLMFTIYALCAVKCFAMSSLYHLHCHRSFKSFRFYSCLDYAGISIMIMGSCILTTYYIYYCHDAWHTIWQILLVLTSSVGILGPFFESFTSARVKAISFIISGIFSGFPVAWHLAFDSIPFFSHGLQFFILMVLTYFIGALIYVFQVPERYKPGAFDFLFHSHQIWHVMVFIASLFFLIASLDMKSWRDQKPCE